MENKKKDNFLLRRRSGGNRTGVGTGTMVEGHGVMVDMAPRGQGEDMGDTSAGMTMEGMGVIGLGVASGRGTEALKTQDISGIKVDLKAVWFIEEACQE